MAGIVDYRNKTAIITGASSGIGAALAKTLAGRGAHVALVARRRDRLEQLSAEIANAGGESSVHGCDVSQRGEVEAACRDIVQRWGGGDMLVNNAGYGRHILVKDHDVDHIE